MMIKEFNLRFVIAEEIEFKAEIRRPGRAEVFNEHFYEFLLVAFELNKHKSQSQFPFRMVITDRFLQLNSILEECFDRSSLSLRRASQDRGKWRNACGQLQSL